MQISERLAGQSDCLWCRDHLLLVDGHELYRYVDDKFELAERFKNTERANTMEYTTDGLNAYSVIRIQFRGCLVLVRIEFTGVVSCAFPKQRLGEVSISAYLVHQTI